MPPSKNVEKEEAAATAEVSADWAEKAAELAEKDALTAARAAAGAPVCPHCRGELIKHDDRNPAKAGASHCNNCGACWAPGLREMRANHPPPADWLK